MTVRLKETADLVTSCVASEARPFVALEHLESGMGRLAADVELPERPTPESGAASVDPGDVLFGKLRPYLAKTWLADRPVFASTELLCLRPRAQVDGRWLAYLVASSPVVEWAVATSDGTKMPRTSWEKLAEYRIGIPPIGDQRAVADYLDRETARIDALIERYERLKEQLSRRLDARISRATCAVWVGMGGALPSDWRVLPLRRCFAGVDYGIGERSQSSGPIAVLGMGNVEPRKVVGEPGGYVELLDDRLLLLPGDLLFNRTNSLVLVGKVAIWFGTDQPTTFASYLVRLRTSSIADPRYLNYLLNTDEVLALARAMALPSIGQANLNPNRYGSLRIPLPSLSVQRRLASELEVEESKTEALTAKLQKQVLLLAEHRQALITAAVTGELQIPRVAA